MSKSIDLKQRLMPYPPRVKLKDMPQDIRYNKLTTESKMIMNIIKMICYRTETAVANLAAPYLVREEDEKRKFILQIIDSPVDMKVNQEKNFGHNHVLTLGTMIQ